MRWTVLIPAKALPAAKSRLLAASPDAAAHARLVEAIRADTVAAARAVPQIARIVVVTDRPAAVGDAPADDAPAGHVFVQSAPGLNAALGEAAAYARRSWPDDGVAVLVADLPALSADQLDDALTLAGGHRRAHVPDAQGTGTTLLTAAPGVDLDPTFGPDSARRHAASSARLDAGPGLRRDVDTVADLRAAGEIGLGPRTSAALAAVGDTRRSTSPGMMADMNDACGPKA